LAGRPRGCSPGFRGMMGRRIEGAKIFRTKADRQDFLECLRVLCEDDPCLLELARFIHLNPVRAGVPRPRGVEKAERLSRYPWTGHSPIVGRVERIACDEGVLGSVSSSLRNDVPIHSFLHLSHGGRSPSSGLKVIQPRHYVPFALPLK
jgi:hypothetical protein